MDISDSTNQLVNRKLILYEWIRPEHLELDIHHENLEHLSQSLKAIPSLSTSTEKILHVMQTIERLYRIIGQHEDQGKMLSAIIYCIIKSSVTNIYLEAQFMAKYRRRIADPCTLECLHGIGINIHCDYPAPSMYSEKEITYYLTSFQAAIDFIRRMEYYDLKISESEFHANIMEAIKLAKDF
ncbi:vacuolar sorting protein 9 [Ordospora pajunii]|jgi:hypothetical protein|uniref:vacuolar sorting protein 9 n=1 Tax=Ordospora pajunii TaxID=3039483 RepID=UPI0029527A93|nr:vacuolar sorting protein 9 [Ordospora pajunii]KAH9411073.1 vacuolar sorting protein 9 [Ordospora pajunii]